jgi:hypothetical protein
MSNPTPLTRQEHLQTLPAFSAALAAALKHCGPGEEKLRPALDSALAAECVLCGITLTGSELLAIGAAAEESAGDNPKLARLRQGDCARNGCRSYFYRLTFTPHPDLDWAKVLSQTEIAKTGQQVEAREEEAALAAARRAVGWKLIRRLLVGLALVAMLWLIRQWYSGGTIPLLREPEHFKPDPASVEPRPVR